VPIIFFFISSGILSAIKTSESGGVEKLGKGGQGLGSGARKWRVGAICTIGFGITGNPLWYFLYLGSTAEACADTWATEIGSLSKTDPVSIINFKKMEAGFSEA